MNQSLLFAATALSLSASLAPLSGQSVDDLKIERRSHTGEKAVERNPFWPINWTPEDKRPVRQVRQPTVTTVDYSFFTPGRFVVSSISIGSVPLAVINGSAHAQGDSIKVNTSQGVVEVKVEEIKDGTVTLSYAGRKLQTTLDTSIPASARPQSR